MNLFASSSILESTLRNLIDSTIKDDIFEIVKEYVSKYNPNDFQVNSLVMIKLLYRFIAEFYKKQNVRFTMASQIVKIEQTKNQIQDCELSINFAKQGIVKCKDEIKELEF